MPGMYLMRILFALDAQKRSSIAMDGTVLPSAARIKPGQVSPLIGHRLLGISWCVAPFLGGGTTGRGDVQAIFFLASAWRWIFFTLSDQRFVIDPWRMNFHFPKA